MDSSIHGELLSQTLETNNKQFKTAVSFMTGYNGVFNVTIKNNRCFFAKSKTDKDGFIQRTLQPGAYEIESLNIEIKRFNIEKSHFTELDYLSAKNQIFQVWVVSKKFSYEKQ